jgi:glycyl-tRNA synthetase beta chain
MKSFLLEIGTEEIPARFIPRGLSILNEGVSRLFSNSAIDYGEIHEYASPRRLTLLIEDVAGQQKDRTVETMGPPRKVAFDDSGSPTKAAAGFARSLNIDASALKIVKTDRGEYVSAIIEEKGRRTIDVLGEALPKMISSLQLPKSMRWGSGMIRFFRPIHWIVALYGEEIIPFALEGIKSTNVSYGHRFLSPAAISITAPENYVSELSANNVIVDREARERIILDGLKKIEARYECRIPDDRELLNVVVNLVEYPTVVLGSFDKKFLNLPKDLLVTVMRTHQKYFSTDDGKGNILPYFIVVSNTKSENNGTVSRGAERVLRARLEDACFYYDEDRTRPIIDYVEELKNVTFQEKLGSLFQKTERVVELCAFIAEQVGIQKKDDILRAAKLARADLVTGVVSEFPELQGYMGQVYASASGENSEVSSAIYEHYLPRFAGDKLPSSETGAILSLADKIDSIASFFYLDLIPTGSEDPYALRRQAAGIVNILQDRDYPISLDSMVNKALLPLEGSDKNREELTKKVLQFFHPRFEGIYLSQGHTIDIINAVLPSENLNIRDINYRIGLLTALKKEAEFSDLLAAAKRVYNILVKARPGEVRASLLSEHAEKNLLKAVTNIKEKILKSDFKSLLELKDPINTFFDDVLVMDRDPQIKENRLALLFSVKSLFDSLGDFSKLA